MQVSPSVTISERDVRQPNPHDETSDHRAHNSAEWERTGRGNNLIQTFVAIHNVTNASSYTLPNLSSSPRRLLREIDGSLSPNQVGRLTNRDDLRKSGRE